MARSLLERLRAALSHQYEIEREIGAGGMGTVFLARDVTLERRVAIKILRPELATASASKRFLREARVLANLIHPNVVPVHSAGEADGLLYYVMDYVQGETLAERLQRGALTSDQAAEIGADILAALEAAHRMGIVHRDIKPSNIFLVGERVMLSDFGLAKPIDEDASSLTADDHAVGTPAYMAPEQFSGDATPQTDFYAVGMTLYESMTGRRWQAVWSLEDADWTGVPSRLAAVLRRALARSPADRWESASMFRGALSEPAVWKARLPDIARTIVIAAALLIAVFGVWRFLGPSVRGGVEPPPSADVSDLVILPVDVIGDWDVGIDGRDLAELVADKLRRVPDLQVRDTRVSFPWWDSASAHPGPAPEVVAARELRARHAAHATLIASGGGVSIELAVLDPTGMQVPGSSEIRLSRGDLFEVSDSITLRLLRVVLGEDLPPIERLTPDVDAVIQFLLGERAFSRGAWRLAVQYDSAAVSLDSTFALAWWRLANAWRWVGESGPYPKDFRELFDEYGPKLGPLDSMLMLAQLTPAGEERFEIYERASALYPQDDFAAFLYGEELFNRGPLFGRNMAEAVEALETALAVNPYWASTYVHLIWAAIRSGRSEVARKALDQIPEIAASPEEGWQYPPQLFEHAYVERFGSAEEAAAGRMALAADSDFGEPEYLAMLARLTGSFDLPATQVAFGGLVVERAEDLPLVRAGAHLAQGLGFVALGRSGAALDHIDSVAAILNTTEAALQAAEWRVIPNALGLPFAQEDELEAGRRALVELASHEALADRAAWALTMDALASGDAAAVARWSARVQKDSLLQVFLRAALEAGRGRYREAVDISDPLLAYQVSAIPLRGSDVDRRSLSDPFARSALHLKRADWFEQLELLEEAEREWRWYEAEDIDGLPTIEPAQAGEIDWALGNYARFRRGMAALRRDDIEAGCRHLNRVVELWSAADSATASLAHQARTAADRACG